MLTIPEGYEIKENIEDKAYKCSPDIASYTRKVKADGNKIEVQTNIEVKKTQVDPKFYERIRYFYTRAVAAEAEQIVLTRKQSDTSEQNKPVQPGSSAANESTAKGKK